MLVVNLFAGPGAGKSTLAAATFAALKKRGVCAELVTEFAKDCAWEGRTGPLRCQPYVFGEQLWRMERLRGRGVEIAVTDSPILLSAIYAGDDAPPEFAAAVRAYAAREDAVNILVLRSKPYDPRGRFQTEEEARALDLIMQEEAGPFHARAYGDPHYADAIADMAIRTRAARS
jgi:hypothetical protein